MSLDVSIEQDCLECGEYLDECICDEFFEYEDEWRSLCNCNLCKCIAETEDDTVCNDCALGNHEK